MYYNTMLGYRKGEDGQPEIIPEEAEVVRDIFDGCLSGMSLKQVTDSLNARGLVTKYGKKPWTGANIQLILRNVKYTGDALLQKTYITDCISKKTRKNDGALPMYLVKNHHEGIISREQFNRVQGKYSARFALTELLICGDCGANYRLVTWTAKGFKEIKWRCINRLQYGKRCASVHQPLMENRFTEPLSRR